MRFTTFALLFSSAITVIASPIPAAVTPAVQATAAVPSATAPIGARILDRNFFDKIKEIFSGPVPV
jgi:hypothetical protein